MVEADSIYRYSPSHAAPAVFAVLIGLSLLLHVYQNFHYRYWRVMFFMCWGGLVFTAGWIMRCVSSYNPSNRDLYISQTVLVLAGPPIYSAAEYNLLGRLMHYLPMHAPLNPGRLVYFFIYVGVAVESLTAAGASQMASAAADADQYYRGETLVSIALVLQAAVECLFMSVVFYMHRRCARSHMLPRNVRTLFIMLYGTSALILLRCIFRAIDSFSTRSLTDCTGLCHIVRHSEWYLYVFEAVPMLIYTYWLNVVHPGKLLPRDHNRYLDLDGQTERLGPGWVDKRSKLATFVDLFDISGTLKGQPSHDQFWLRANDWPEASGASYARSPETHTLGKLGRWSVKTDEKSSSESQSISSQV